MAKIIVTSIRGNQHVVDTNGDFVFHQCTGKVCVKDTDGKYIGPIKESLEEIQILINEAEAKSTNAKIDLILETLESIKKRLDELDTREVISVEEF